MELQNIVLKINLKKVMIIPVVMLAVSLFVVIFNMHAGTVPLGVELKGGTLVTVYGTPEGDFENILEKKLDTELRVDTISDMSGTVGYTIQIDRFLDIAKKEEVTEFFASAGIPREKIILRDSQPSISSRFLLQGIKAMIFAFLFMAVVIFLRFKTLVPSAAVVLSAFSDIVVTMAVMILLDIQFTSGSLVALLLLIGYSVDTDILLTTRVLVRRVGDFNQRLGRAMKTGITMSSTTISAVTILYLATSSVVLKEIVVVIIIGLLVDFVNTWVQNAGILRIYLERAK